MTQQMGDESDLPNEYNNCVFEPATTEEEEANLRTIFLVWFGKGAHPKNVALILHQVNKGPQLPL